MAFKRMYAILKVFGKKKNKENTGAMRTTVNGREELKAQEEPKVVEILALGGMSGIGQKNSLAILCGKEAIVIDCGEKIQNDAMENEADGEEKDLGEKKRRKEKPADSYVDLGLLNGFDVLLLALTHGHWDHVGGTHKFYEKFPKIPWMGHPFTLDIAEDNLRDNGIKVMPQRIEGDVYEVRGFKIRRFLVNHSIPGSCGYVIDVGGKRIVITGDCKEWVIREDKAAGKITDKNKEVFGRIAEDGPIDLLVVDSTNANRSGERIISENRVGHEIGSIFFAEPGRVFVTIFPSNVLRMSEIIKQASAQNRKVYVAGPKMWRMLHRWAMYQEEDLDWRKLSVRKSKEGNGNFKFHLDPAPETLPENAVIICSGSQGDARSFLRRLSDEEFAFPCKYGDILIVAQSIIARDDHASDRFVQMMTNLIGNSRMPQRMTKLYLHSNAPWVPTVQNVAGVKRSIFVHTSGHGPKEHKQMIWQVLKPRVTIPWHGHSDIRKIAAEAIRELGGEAVLLNDGEKFVL